MALAEYGHFKHSGHRPPTQPRPHSVWLLPIVFVLLCSCTYIHATCMVVRRLGVDASGPCTARQLARTTVQIGGAGWMLQITKRVIIIQWLSSRVRKYCE